MALDTTIGGAAADSYATVAELRAYAAKRGASLPAADGPGDAACEVLLITACDYIQALSERFKGVQASQSQALCWPRYGVSISGYELPSDAIPADIKNAQCQLAIDGQTIDLLPTIDVGASGAVVREKVDTLEVQYAEPVSQRTAPLLGRANALLSKYFGAGMNQVRLVRG